MNKNEFLINLSESERTQFGRVAFLEQTDSQKIFSAIWELESQVNNGGFEQYFCSDGGQTASFAPTALASIGATKCAAIVSRALHAVFRNRCQPIKQNARISSTRSRTTPARSWQL